MRLKTVELKNKKTLEGLHLGHEGVICTSSNTDTMSHLGT